MRSSIHIFRIRGKGLFCCCWGTRSPGKKKQSHPVQLPGVQQVQQHQSRHTDGTIGQSCRPGLHCGWVLTWQNKNRRVQKPVTTGYSSSSWHQYLSHICFCKPIYMVAPKCSRYHIIAEKYKIIKLFKLYFFQDSPLA